MVWPHREPGKPKQTTHIGSSGFQVFELVETIANFQGDACRCKPSLAPGDGNIVKLSVVRSGGFCEMAGTCPRPIHVLIMQVLNRKTWMPGTSPVHDDFRVSLMPGSAS